MVVELVALEAALKLGFTEAGAIGIEPAKVALKLSSVPLLIVPRLRSFVTTVVVMFRNRTRILSKVLLRSAPTAFLASARDLGRRRAKKYFQNSSSIDTSPFGGYGNG